MKTIIITTAEQRFWAKVRKTESCWKVAQFISKSAIVCTVVIATLSLMTGCLDLEAQAEVRPAARHLTRWYDSEFGVVCFQPWGDSSISCVKVEIK